MLLRTTSHAFMQARQQAGFFEGGFAKLASFFFFSLFIFVCLFVFGFYFSLLVLRVGSTSLWVGVSGVKPASQYW